MLEITYAYYRDTYGGTSTDIRPDTVGRQVPARRQTVLELCRSCV